MEHKLPEVSRKKLPLTKGKPYMTEGRTKVTVTGLLPRGHPFGTLLVTNPSADAFKHRNNEVMIAKSFVRWTITP